MNILFINANDKKGGAGIVSYNLKKQLELLGHTTSMFVHGKTSVDDNVFVIPRSKVRFTLSHLLGTDIDLFHTDFILDRAEFKKADIIHCHNINSHFFNLNTLVKISKHKPIVWTHHDMWPITPYCSHSFAEDPSDGFFPCPGMSSKSIMKKYNWRYLKWRKETAYRHMTLNIASPSLWLFSKINRSILKSKNTIHIPNGIDTKVFKKLDKETSRRELGLPINKKIIFFSSNGGKNNIWKGWNFAKEIIKRFKDRDDILFICAGGDKDHKEGNLLSVKYINDDHLMAKYYNSADIFLFTSIAENFPLTILEAMGCGLPIVSFDVGGVKEAVIHHQNGYIAKYKDISDLMHGIKYIFELNQEEKEKISANSISRIADNFSLETMTKGYLNLYDKLISEKNTVENIK